MYGKIKRGQVRRRMKPKPVDNYKPCELCKGEGWHWRETSPCESCNGIGWKLVMRPITEPFTTEAQAIYYASVNKLSVEFRSSANHSVGLPLVYQEHERVKLSYYDRFSGTSLAIVGKTLLEAANKMREILIKLFPPGVED